MKRFLLVFFMASIFLFGCSSSPKVDYDKTTNFSTIKSFSLAQSLDSPDQVRSDLITNSIEKHLTSKGLNKTDGSESDIFVSFYAVLSEEPNNTSFSFGLGTGIGGRSGGISLGSILSVPVGKQSVFYQNLRIDIFQGNTIIWSGVDEVEIETGNGIELQTKIDELVTNILTLFPPAP